MLTGVGGGGGGGAAEVAGGAGGGVALVVVVVGVGGQRRQVVGLVALAAGLDRGAVGVAIAARVVEPRLQRRRVRALYRHAEQPRRQRPPLAFLFFFRDDACKNGRRNTMRKSLEFRQVVITGTQSLKESIGNSGRFMIII